MRHRFYLDSNILIYAIEKYPGLDAILKRLQSDIEAEKVDVFTSELTLSEVLVKPIAEKDAPRIAVYQNRLRSAGCFQVIPVSRKILIEAASIRSANKLKLPDAIHFATAGLNRCTHFVTNDTHFRDGYGMKILSPLQLQELQ